jgi:TonB family protein
MFAAVRSGAGWLLIGTALGLAGCSAIPLPDIAIPMPALPGFGPREIPPEMEPIPLAVDTPLPAAPAPVAVATSERPAFFVQWKANMPGLTRRPRVDASTPLPDYPEEARREEEAGITTLESCVTVEGRLVDVKLARSSGSATLDSATLAWARTATFQPALIDGQPMAVCGWRLDHEWRVASN